MYQADGVFWLDWCQAENEKPGVVELKSNNPRVPGWGTMKY
jgi:hypothetical protein